METMHLMDAEAKEALCRATVNVLDLTSVQDYLERRVNNLPVSTIYDRCKVVAVLLPSCG